MLIMIIFLLGQIKSINKIQNVIELQAHRAIQCFGSGRCDGKVVNENIGTWHHYRSACSRNRLKECEVSTNISINKIQHIFLKPFT